MPLCGVEQESSLDTTDLSRSTSGFDIYIYINKYIYISDHPR